VAKPLCLIQFYGIAHTFLSGIPKLPYTNVRFSSQSAIQSFSAVSLQSPYRFLVLLLNIAFARAERTFLLTMDKLESITGRREHLTPRAQQIAFAFSHNGLLVGVAGTLVAVLMAGLSILTLYRERVDAIAQASQNAANLVALISNDIARNVELYDLSLLSMADMVQNPRVQALPPALRRLLVFSQAATATHLGGAYLVNAAGKISDQAFFRRIPDGLVADLPYFTAQQQNPNLGLYIPPPFRSRIGRKPWVVALSRRLNNPDGSFAGVVAIAIRVDYFQSVLNKIDTGRHGSVFISTNDGTLLARRSNGEDDTFPTSSVSLPFSRTIKQGSGVITKASSIDGIRRIYTYATIPHTPFIAVVGPAEEDVLAAWKRRSWLVGTLSACLGIAFICMSWVLAYSIRERTKIQAELVEIAGSDPLTGLRTRRVLDNRIEEECRRARRSGTRLSVLFVDIDHFKGFNDLFGHAAGDQAIAAVSAAIKGALKRPADLAARYGGEEFVILLPDTRPVGALTVAEELRQRVHQLAIAHPGNDHNFVTISIGCATTVPESTLDASDLMRRADNALYRAKMQGRNRIEISEA